MEYDISTVACTELFFSYPNMNQYETMQDSSYSNTVDTIDNNDDYNLNFNETQNQNQTNINCNQTYIHCNQTQNQTQTQAQSYASSSVYSTDWMKADSFISGSTGSGRYDVSIVVYTVGTLPRGTSSVW